MTFVINQNDAVFEKDLGKETVQATAAISEFNPDKSGARGVTAILEEKRSFGKNRGRQVCESQTTSLMEISAAEGACRRN